MAGFDPDRATRQMFVDAIVAALGRRDGDGFGWHFTFLSSVDATTTIGFETPRALRGWSEEQPDIQGPHRVYVTVATTAAR